MSIEEADNSKIEWRYFADAARAEEVPSPSVFHGLGDVLRDLEEMARVVRHSLDVEVLGLDLKR